jgi:predicted branched-subunit amino acid permease
MVFLLNFRMCALAFHGLPLQEETERRRGGQAIICYYLTVDEVFSLVSSRVINISLGNF